MYSTTIPRQDEEQFAMDTGMRVSVEALAPGTPCVVRIMLPTVQSESCDLEAPFGHEWGGVIQEIDAAGRPLFVTVRTTGELMRIPLIFGNRAMLISLQGMPRGYVLEASYAATQRIDRKKGMAYRPPTYNEPAKR